MTLLGFALSVLYISRFNTHYSMLFLNAIGSRGEEKKKKIHLVMIVELERRVSHCVYGSVNTKTGAKLVSL